MCDHFKRSQSFPRLSKASANDTEVRSSKRRSLWRSTTTSPSTRHGARPPDRCGASVVQPTSTGYLTVCAQLHHLILKVMAEFGNWHGVACDASSDSNLSAKEILTTFFKNFSEGKLALALAMDSDSVLYIIKGSWEAILTSYGQIEFWNLKWWYII